jgi:uncharacterized protein involved in exopolysaccharide biosynthesis
MIARRPTVDERNRQRRKRSAIILGNLIIVGTFIARDVLRESLKERLDNLNTAQVAFVTRYDVSTMLVQMMDFANQVNHFIHRSELRETGREANDEDKLRYEFEIMNQRVSTERVILQNIETLLRGINKPLAEYADLKSKSDATATALQEIQDRKDESVSHKTIELFKVRAIEDPLLERILSLGQRCWESSKELSELLEKRYRYINYVFFALFTLGVGVNLWGALSGLDIEEGSL